MIFNKGLTISPITREEITEEKIKMKEEITEEEIKNIYRNSILLPFSKILDNLNIGKMPNVKPIILKNGYGIGMSIEYDDKKEKINRKIIHVYISHPNGKIDPAIADILALKVLGKGYIFIDLMSTNQIFHYMKEEKIKDR